MLLESKKNSLPQHKGINRHVKPLQPNSQK